MASLGASALEDSIAIIRLQIRDRRGGVRQKPSLTSGFRGRRVDGIVINGAGARRGMVAMGSEGSATRGRQDDIGDQIQRSVST
jgi:hypothetical protein